MKLNKNKKYSIPLQLVCPQIMGGVFTNPKRNHDLVSLVDLSFDKPAQDRILNLRQYPRILDLKQGRQKHALVWMPIGWQYEGLSDIIKDYYQSAVQGFGHLRERLFEFGMGRKWAYQFAVVFLTLGVLGQVFFPWQSNSAGIPAIYAQSLEQTEILSASDTSLDASKILLATRQLVLEANHSVGQVARARQEEYDRFSTFVGSPYVEEEALERIQSLPATLAVFERARPPADWLDQVERKPLEGIYSPQNEYWLDENGRFTYIVNGFAITKIPERVAPMYELSLIHI